MATQSPKISKIQEELNKDSLDSPSPLIPSLNAPRGGTVIPNRVFVGGISSTTTEADLMNLFSSYGTVTGAKIIADRAGVSKGYGFVTFETEDEARRLQADADNIVLRERRLNIAPAIKKTGNFGFMMSGMDAQARFDTVPTPNGAYNGYGRGVAYELSGGGPPSGGSGGAPGGGTLTSHPAAAAGVGQIYRQNGIAYTFHNGMAFFPQPNHPPPLAPSPMDHNAAMYSTGGGGYGGGSAGGGGGNAYQYPAYSQGQVIYQPAPPSHFQYHLASYEGCYETGGQLLMSTGEGGGAAGGGGGAGGGGMMLPQYFIQSPPELTYFQPAPTPSHLQQHLHHPPHPQLHELQMLYSGTPAAPRPPSAFDHLGPMVFSAQEPASGESEGGGGGVAAVVQVQEVDTSAPQPVSSNHSAQSSGEISTTSDSINNPLNQQQRFKETTPVVSLKVYNSKDSGSMNGGGKPRTETLPQHNYQRRKPRVEDGKPRYDDGRRFHLNNNNNNPDATNRNLIGYHQQPQQQTFRRRGPEQGAPPAPESRGYSPAPRSLPQSSVPPASYFHSAPPPPSHHPRHPFHHPSSAPPLPPPFYTHHPSQHHMSAPAALPPHRARSFTHRPRFNGGGGRGGGMGRGGHGYSGGGAQGAATGGFQQKWQNTTSTSSSGAVGGGNSATTSTTGNQTNDPCQTTSEKHDSSPQSGQPLTPPVTPKSGQQQQQSSSTNVQQQQQTTPAATEDLVKSIQAVAI